MKTRITLKSIILLCALIVGSVSEAWAQTPVTIWSENFNGLAADATPTSPTNNSYTGVTYTCTNGAGSSPGSTKVMNEKIAGGSDAPELMVGKKGSGTGAAGGYFTAVIPLDNYEGTLTLTYYQNKQSLKVSSPTSGVSGGQTVKPSDVGKQTTTFTGIKSSMTSITIVFEATTTNNVRLDDIVLTGFKASSTTTPSITASNVNIDYNATNGSIGYQLANGTGNVSASVTSGDWLTLGTVTASAVPFTCSANTGTTARTAQVTLSFTGATDKVVTVTQAAAGVANPSINVTSSSPTSFSYVEGNGPSDASTISVSGSNLTANISISFGDNSDYEMSLAANGTYTNSLTLTQSEGTVSKTTIYFRLKAGLAKGTHNGTLTLSSTGATDVVINLSGTVAGQTHAVTCVADPVAGGTIEANPTSAYEGQEVTLSYSVNEGYSFSSIVITKTSDGSATGITPSKGEGNTYTFVMPGYAVTATVNVIQQLDNIALTVGQTLTFTDFSDLGSYSNDRTDYLVASDGKSYKWTGSQYCYSGATLYALQMRAQGNNNGTGTITSGTITSPRGITLTLTYVCGTDGTEYPTLTVGNTTVAAISRTTNKENNPNTIVFDITSTSTPITIGAGAKATYIKEIKIVAKKNPTTLTFANDAQSVAVGATATYVATGSREGIVYSSGDETIATVDPATGEVTGVSEGTVTITAKLEETENYDGATATYSLTVFDNSKTQTTIELAQDTYEVMEGKTLQVIPTVTEGYDGTLEYESSNSKVATVAADGTVTGVAKGSVTITVTAPATDNFTGASASYTLNVTRLDDIFKLDSNCGLSNSNDYTGATGSYGLIVASKGTGLNHPKYYTNGDAVRFYSNNTLTISSGSYGIKKVVIEKGGTWNAPTIDNENYSVSNQTWTANEGKATNYVVFSFDGQAYIKSVTVIYTDIEDQKEGVVVKFAASGYATYCSPFALDLTPTADYAAWGVTETSGTSVTFTKIPGAVPAETPFILYGKEMGGQTVTLPVAADETTAVADNMLVGTLEPTPITTVNGDYTNFGLSGGNFVKIKNGTLPANKAYLPVLTSKVPTNGTRLTIVFNDETTGISDVSHLTVNGQSIKDSVYDLQGRLVVKPTKGLYIVNGKKVVIK